MANSIKIESPKGQVITISKDGATVKELEEKAREWKGKILG